MTSAVATTGFALRRAVDVAWMGASHPQTTYCGKCPAWSFHGSPAAGREAFAEHALREHDAPVPKKKQAKG